MERADDSDEGLMRQVALGMPEPLSALMGRYASPLMTFIQRTVGAGSGPKTFSRRFFWRSGCGAAAIGIPVRSGPGCSVLR